MTSLHSPFDLCERLGLRPTSPQSEIMQQFYENVDPLDLTEVPSERTVHAVALCALWRLLLIHNSRCIVIAANRELESRFMDFMHKITTEIDPALTSICKWANARILKVGDDAGYELRFVSNRPTFLKGVHNDEVTWVVLGARSSETHFNDTMKIVDSYRGQEGHRHIIVW